MSFPFQTAKTEYHVLQGRVKFPTGGKAREHYARTGGIPVPTVTVWMEEVKLIYLIR